jgi:hypothetical protein
MKNDQWWRVKALPLSDQSVVYDVYCNTVTLAVTSESAAFELVALLNKTVIDVETR